MFLDTVQTNSAMQVTIPNGLNSNDGPAPWTVLDADLIGTQLALYDLQINDITAVQSQMSVEVRPTILLQYRDAANLVRTKFITFPISINESFTSPPPPASRDFLISLLPGSTITNLSISGSSISFTANFGLSILGYSRDPRNFAIMQEFSCLNPPINTPTECVFMIRLSSICTADSTNSVFVGSIPFQPLGTPPYRSGNIMLLNTNPNIISVANNDFDFSLDMELSFPAILSYFDSTNTQFTQDVLVYFALQAPGKSLAPNEQVIANLRIVLASPPVAAANVFVTNIRLVTGNIMIINNQSEQVLITPLVDCGPHPVDGVCIVGNFMTTSTGF